MYLGYFWDDFTKVDNAEFSIARGLEIREQNSQEQGFLHPFEALDDDFVFVNQTQEDFPLFEMPVELQINLPSGPIHKTIWVEKKYNKLKQEKAPKKREPTSFG